MGEAGCTLKDYIEVCEMVDDKVDLFNISAGSHEIDALYGRTHPNQFFSKGCNVYLSAEIKKHVSHPVSCVGGITDPAMCEEILESGKADFIELGRALVADPDFPKKAKTGAAKDITPCLRCMLCYSEARRIQSIRCSVNPTIGAELSERFYTAPPQKKKKVLVVGGGPGGLEAAITAAKRGHDVTLYERTDRLGGMLNAASVPDFKKDLVKYVECLGNRAISVGVKIQTNTEVTPELARSFEADVIIAAVGGEPIVPRIKGIDKPNVIMAHEAETNPDKLGEQLIVLGGGLVGCEAAIFFAQKGHNVSIVEMRDGYALDAPYRHRCGLVAEIERLGIQIYTSATGKEIRDDGLLCTKPGGEELFIPANRIICAVGVKPHRNEAEELRELAPEYYAIGDCVRPRQIVDAVTEGHYIAMDL